MKHMKIQEAIEKMQYRISTAIEIVGKGENGKEFEDMEMAIKALEIQQKMIEHCERKCGSCPCWDGKSDICMNDFII